MTTTTEDTDRPRSAETQAPRSSEMLGGEVQFADRHVGPRLHEIQQMLETMGYDSLDALIDTLVPENIRDRRPLGLPAARSEHEVRARGPPPRCRL